MYYLYILYSEQFDKYHVGITDNLDRRLFQHNNSPLNTFTSKYRPWDFFIHFEVSETLSFARKVENKVKRQKNRVFYSKLLDPDFRKNFLASVV